MIPALADGEASFDAVSTGCLCDEQPTKMIAAPARIARMFILARLRVCRGSFRSGKRRGSPCMVREISYK
jgi:hypothetical protein